MASWVVHLRIADLLVDNLNVDMAHFFAGSIAPDCGLPDGKGGYEPNMYITHLAHGTSKGTCDYMQFWDKYVKGETDKLKYSFYLGYFVHLLTDVIWVKWINDPTKEKYKDLYSADRDNYYKTVKRDWYDLDARYLERNPDFRGYKEFCKLTDFENTFLPYYKKDNFIIQFANIRSFYNGEFDTDREFTYLKPYEVDEFVIRAVEHIRDVIKNLK